jgi:hypothetical protein
MASYGYTFQSGDGVTPTRLNDARTISAIQAADISDAQITAAKLASNAVETAKILDANVTTAKIADSAVTTAKINDSAVTTAKVNNAAVTAAKLDGAQTGSAPIYGCRAWVNFDGTRNAADTAASTNGATVKVRASGNVTSVLKNGVGDYTITFTTAMQDANYAVVAAAGTGNNNLTDVSHNYNNADTSSTCRVLISYANTLTIDAKYCSVSIFR